MNLVTLVDTSVYHQCWFIRVLCLLAPTRRGPSLLSVGAAWLWLVIKIRGTTVNLQIESPSWFFLVSIPYQYAPRTLIILNLYWSSPIIPRVCLLKAQIVAIKSWVAWDNLYSFSIAYGRRLVPGQTGVLQMTMDHGFLGPQKWTVYYYKYVFFNDNLGVPIVMSWALGMISYLELIRNKRRIKPWSYQPSLCLPWIHRIAPVAACPRMK